MEAKYIVHVCKIQHPVLFEFIVYDSVILWYFKTYMEFSSFSELNKSQVDANMKFWQIYGKFKSAITSSYL